MGGIFQRTQQLDGRGRVTSTRYDQTVVGPKGPVALLTREGGEVSTSYLHSDKLGSIVASSSATGERSGVARFTPFGTPVGAIVSNGASLGFGGHELDSESSLINMKGRIYDPTLRRFMTPDPVVQAPAWGQSHNRYSYAWNNPSNYTDPTGFQTFCDELSSAARCPPDGIRVSRGVDGEPVLDFTIAQQNGFYGGVLEGGTTGGQPFASSSAFGSSSPAPTPTPAGSIVQSNVFQGLGGFAVGLLQTLVPGGVLTDVSDSTLGTHFTSGGTQAAQLGKGIGQLVGGVGQMFLGLGGTVGGGLLSATGVGSLVGVPAAVASAGLLTNGVLSAGAGLANLSLVYAKSSSGGSSPGGASGWSKKEPGDPSCTSGCQDFATEIQNQIGGQIKHITPKQGRVLGQVRDSNGVLQNPAGSKGMGWYDHYVVVKDGRVYDALTGPQGQTIAEYKARWEYADVINFGF